VLINEACIIKSSRVAVRIIGRTKLPIGCARIAAGDAVTVASPGPSHRVAHRDIDRVWNKYEAALPHRYVEDLTATRWHAADRRLAVLIYNINGVAGLFLLCYDNVPVARLSLRRQHQCKRHCQGESDSCCV
jgi:hypothetical protein